MTFSRVFKLVGYALLIPLLPLILLGWVIENLLEAV